MAPTRRAGTGFINLSDWAAANAAGSQRLADEMAGGVDSKGRAAQASLDGLNEDFWERTRGGTLRYEPDQVDSGRAEYLGREGYTGPQGLYDVAGYDTAMRSAQDAGRNANLLSDFYGRQALLDERAGADGNYTTGQRLLDSALVGGTGGNRFAQLNSQWGGLFDKAQGMERDAANAATEGRRISDESARQYAALAPQLRREEISRSQQAQRAQARADYDAEQAQRRRFEELERERRRNAPRDVTPGPKGRGSAWDI